MKLAHEITFYGLLLVLTMTATFSVIPLANSTTWIQTKRFYRNGGTWEETTDNFTCNHLNWRIKWEYHPWYGGSVFNVTVYEMGVSEPVTTIYDVQYEYILTKTGERCITSNNGTFYLEISVENIAYFCEIVIEQDMDSPGGEAPHKQDTFITLSLEPSEIKKDDSTNIIATISDRYGNPIANQPIGFNVGTIHIGTERTDSSGIAKKIYTANVDVGTYLVNVSYGGNLDLLPSAALGNLTVKKLATTVMVAVPHAVQGKPIILNGTLRDESGNPLQDMTIVFQVYNGTIWATIGSMNTNQNGIASVTYTPSSTGTFEVKAIFAGTTNYSQISDTTTLSVSADLTLYYYVILVVVAIALSAILGYVILHRKRERKQFSM